MHNARDVLATDGTVGQSLPALCTCHHVTTLQQNAVNGSVHADLADVVLGVTTFIPGCGGGCRCLWVLRDRLVNCLRCCKKKSIALHEEVTNVHTRFMRTLTLWRQVICIQVATKCYKKKWNLALKCQTKRSMVPASPNFIAIFFL